MRGRKRSSATASETYLGLRSQILKSSRAPIGLPEPSDLTQPWGVVMDWAVNTGTATVVALSDSSASVYLSSGCGYLCKQKQKPNQKTTQKTNKIAAEFQPEMMSTNEFPLPV